MTTTPLMPAHSPPRSQGGFALAKQGAGIQNFAHLKKLGPRFRGDERSNYRDGGMKLRSKLPGDGMNLRSRPGAIAVTGLTEMRGALGGPTAS